MTTTITPMVTTDPMTAKYRSWGDPQEVAPDVWMHPAFVNTYAFRTAAGLLMVDPGLRPLSQVMRERLRAWSDAPLHTAVYTHGHADHAFGLRAFLEAGERPQIVAQENLPHRFRRYALTHGLNKTINQRQFSSPKASFPDEFDYPTLTFREALVQRIGRTEVIYTAAKGETDDHCYLWLPEQRYLFTGDLVIWHAPNCGNPQKVQRYPLEWAEALEAMAALEPEFLFPGHGPAIQGREAVRKVLTETAAYLRHIIDQVLTRLNAGEKPEQIFHAVEPHPELSTRPYLSARYDHPKFIVRNLLRLWGGWWNGNAAELLPVTPTALGREVATLAGGVEALIARGRALLADGNAQLASHLAEWASQAAPESTEALRLKRDVYERRLAEGVGTMEKGIYRAAMNDARTALGQEPSFPEGLPGFGSSEDA